MEVLKTIGYVILAIFVLIFKGITYLIFGILWLWEQIKYEAKCIRYPPPPGGMYGQMARGNRKKVEAEKAARE